jgi:hypothetical protein
MSPTDATSKSRAFAPCFAFSFLLILGWLPLSLAEAPEPRWKLAVRSYNYAAMPGHILTTAEQHAAEIFHRASIELTWIDCPVSPSEIEKFPACTQVTGSRAVTVKFLPETMARRFGLPLGNRGVTFQGHASYVFYHRVHELSNHGGLSESVVLGHVIAHELGHLLLGEGAHADQGIMMEDLRVQDFRQAERGRLLTFSTEQAQRMRARMLEGLPLCHRPTSKYMATSGSDSCW